MVVLKMTKPIGDEFECEILESPPGENKTEINLVRPCERYKELYDSCSSIRSRMYQYYVYGETLDCSPHWNNFQSCLSYRKTKDINLIRPIIKWEQDFIKLRLECMKQNRAWKFRETPPKDFEKPLPDFIEKRQKDSTLHKYVHK